MTKSIAIVAMLLIVASSALPQSLTTESFAKAKAVLDHSVAAYGGMEELNAIGNVSLQITGESVHRNQSRRPGDLDRTPYTAEIVIDLKNSRARQIQKGQYPGGFNWNNGFVVDAGNRTGFDLIRKTSNPPGAITPAIFKANTRWLPQLVLLNVLERAQSLRYAGKADYDKRPPLQNGKRVLKDGTTTVEIYDIGKGPHTEEMLVAYFPDQKLIFQGDLINRPANADAPTVNDTSVHFLNWIDSKKLAVEATIPVHGPVTTIADFRKAVEEMKVKAN